MEDTKGEKCRYPNMNVHWCPCNVGSKLIQGRRTEVCWWCRPRLGRNRRGCEGGLRSACSEKRGRVVVGRCCSLRPRPRPRRWLVSLDQTECSLHWVGHVSYIINKYIIQFCFWIPSCLSFSSVILLSPAHLISSPELWFWGSSQLVWR